MWAGEGGMTCGSAGQVRERMQRRRGEWDWAQARGRLVCRVEMRAGRRV